jgi:hypothetical protein
MLSQCLGMLRVATPRSHVKAQLKRGGGVPAESMPAAGHLQCNTNDSYNVLSQCLGMLKVATPRSHVKAQLKRRGGSLLNPYQLLGAQVAR